MIKSNYICSCGANYSYPEAVKNCQENHGKPDYRYEDSLCIDCTCHLTERLAEVEKERDELRKAAKDMLKALDDFGKAIDTGEVIKLQSKFPHGDSYLWVLKDKMNALRKAREGE